VRRAAILALARAGDRGAWPMVRARLEDMREWPHVTVAALAYARSFCIEEAGPLLAPILRRGIEPNAWPPDVDVAAVAADLAVVLGGATAEEARRIVEGAEAPASVRAPFTRRRRPPGRCRPGPPPT
jgi:hypothetical protein